MDCLTIITQRPVDRSDAEFIYKISPSNCLVVFHRSHLLYLQVRYGTRSLSFGGWFFNVNFQPRWSVFITKYKWEFVIYCISWFQAGDLLRFSNQGQVCRYSTSLNPCSTTWFSLRKACSLKAHIA